jgi:acetyl-CoA synthetase
VKHVIAQASEAGKFDSMAGSFTRIAVGGAPGARPGGWHDYADSREVLSVFMPEGATRATDPLLLYFTSGTTAKPKLVLHSHQSYPVGHLASWWARASRLTRK